MIARQSHRPRVRPARRALIAFGLAALTVLATLAAAGSASAYQTERVVIVIIDGLRYSEGLGDPSHAFVPRMAALAGAGAIVEPFTNDGLTYTSRAIPAIWCGAWTDVHLFNDPDCGGEQNSYAELPTIFEYYRKHLNRPQADCVYVLKDICSWKASFDTDFGPDYWPLYHTQGSSDLQVWLQAQQILIDDSPRFMLIYLADVDHAGHSGVWATYTGAIEMADYIVGEVWDYLQTDPDYAGKTALFVTNDHGRHTSDWSGHGDNCAGCRAIQLLALGPDIEAGLVSSVPRTLCDLTPTVGELLGFATERSSGAAMQELILPDSSVGENPSEPVTALTFAPVRNPCRPGAEVLLDLPAPGSVVLRVFDASGALVATPFAGTAADPQLRLAWDARARNGGELPSGVYFLEAQAAGRSATRRMVLMR
jgi:hypothetical protein